jgi:hypothetical protein
MGERGENELMLAVARDDLRDRAGDALVGEPGDEQGRPGELLDPSAPEKWRAHGAGADRRAADPGAGQVLLQRAGQGDQPCLVAP